jgi:NADPH-dependent curcumin reductase CurA
VNNRQIILVSRPIGIPGLTSAALQAVCKGIDIFFDNVAGDLGDLIVRQMNPFGRAPQALVDVYAGRNRGKKLVKLSDGAS